MTNRLKTFISRNRIIISILVVPPFFLLATPTILSLPIGLAIVLFGGAIRIYASGYINKNEDIAMEGAYSLTRNPLYLGNFFLGLGFSIASGQPLILIIFIPLFFIIYNATIEQEEGYLLERFGEAYAKYRASTPRFFPKLNSLKNKGSRPFSWHLVKKHREYNTWLGTILGVLLLLLKMYLQ